MNHRFNTYRLAQIPKRVRLGMGWVDSAQLDASSMSWYDLSKQAQVCNGQGSRVSVALSSPPSPADATVGRTSEHALTRWAHLIPCHEYARSRDGSVIPAHISTLRCLVQGCVVLVGVLCYRRALMHTPYPAYIKKPSAVRMLPDATHGVSFSTSLRKCVLLC